MILVRTKYFTVHEEEAARLGAPVIVARPGRVEGAVCDGEHVGLRALGDPAVPEQSKAPERPVLEHVQVAQVRPGLGRRVGGRPQRAPVPRLPLRAPAPVPPLTKPPLPPPLGPTMNLRTVRTIPIPAARKAYWIAL